MDIQILKLAKLKPAKYNPRKDLKPGDSEYEKLKKSILEFNAVEPIIWNKKSGNIVGGHQRVKILKELGYKETEVSVVDLPEDKEKALNLALNKIQGDWDFPMLKEILLELDTGAFDMEITGFNEDEIKELVDWEKPEDEEEDRVKEIKKGLREGIIVIIGWFQILVRPGTAEYDKLWEFAGTKKEWSEEEKHNILKRIYDTIQIS